MPPLASVAHLPVPGLSDVPRVTNPARGDVTVVYLRRMGRSRRTLNLDDDLHRRAHAVLRRLPGNPSLSGLVNEILKNTIPTLEDVADAYENLGDQAAEDAIMASVGRVFLMGVTSSEREEESTT